MSVVAIAYRSYLVASSRYGRVVEITVSCTRISLWKANDVLATAYIFQPANHSLGGTLIWFEFLLEYVRAGVPVRWTLHLHKRSETYAN